MTLENGHYDWFALKVNPEGLVGSEEIIVNDLVIFYPNPVTDALQLHCPPGTKPVRVELYDVEGRQVLTQQTDLERIGMEGFSPGLYTLRVILDDGTVYTDKLVKQ